MLASFFLHKMTETIAYFRGNKCIKKFNLVLWFMVDICQNDLILALEKISLSESIFRNLFDLFSIYCIQTLCNLQSVALPMHFPNIPSLPYGYR